MENGNTGRGSKLGGARIDVDKKRDREGKRDQGVGVG